MKIIEEWIFVLIFWTYLEILRRNKNRIKLHVIKWENWHTLRHNLWKSLHSLPKTSCIYLKIKDCHCLQWQWPGIWKSSWVQGGMKKEGHPSLVRKPMETCGHATLQKRDANVAKTRKARRLPVTSLGHQKKNINIYSYGYRYKYGEKWWMSG